MSQPGMRRIPIVLALALAACGGSKKKDEFPVPGDDPDAGVAASTLPPEVSAEVERAITMVESLSTAAAQAGQDCTQVAAAIKPIADGPDGKALRDLDADPRLNQYSAEINHQYGKQLDAMIEHLGDAIMQCQHDPAVEQILLDTDVIQPAPDQATPDD